tara:strand:- start:733 stop:1002 length:270 start_codon:yes stop_codon:yes gene_type:complete
MNEIIISMLYGMLGASINVALIFANLIREKRFSKQGFSFLAITLIVGGGFAGIVFDIGSNVFSMLAGYAAFDLLGSIKKSFMKKKVKFN